jgi:sugar/nucleoside kinase (ribokinase family)
MSSSANEQSVPPCVAVVGNYNIDLVLAHLDDMPSWGTESVVTHMDPRPAGAAGYSAMALATLGVRPVCIGNVGNDDYGRLLRGAIVSRGGDDRGLLVTPGIQTGLGAALIRRDGQRSFVTYMGHLERLTGATIREAEAASPLFAAAPWVLYTGHFLLPGLDFESCAEMFRRWKAMGKTVLFDTGWDPLGWSEATKAEIRQLLQWVDIFLPNEDEARVLTGLEDPAGAAAALAGYGPRAVVVKLGALGALAWSDGTVVTAPGVAVDAFDTTGAGDSFNAGLIFGRLQNWSWKASLRYANQVASIVVSRRQDRFPTQQDVANSTGMAGTGA